MAARRNGHGPNDAIQNELVRVHVAGERERRRVSNHYVFKTKNGECYENNDQQNFAKETLFPRKTKRELLDEEELNARIERMNKKPEMISRIQSSIDESKKEFYDI